MISRLDGGMKPEVHITSYFSLETDLASELSSWPEFVSGREYDVELESADKSQRVTVKFVAGTGNEGPYVRVAASALGELFDRVLGRVAHALAAHSDYLMIHRWDRP